MRRVQDRANVSTAPEPLMDGRFIRRQIAMGKDKQQVKDALVGEFGPGARLAARRRGSASPPTSSRLGLGLLALTGWPSRHAASAAGLLRPRPSRLDDDDALWLDAELAAYDRR